MGVVKVLLEGGADIEGVDYVSYIATRREETPGYEQSKPVACLSSLKLSIEWRVDTRSAHLITMIVMIEITEEIVMIMRVPGQLIN